MPKVFLCVFLTFSDLLYRKEIKSAYSFNISIFTGSFKHHHKELKSVSLLQCPIWFSWATCVGCSFWHHTIKPCKVSIWTHCRKEAGSLVLVGTSVFIWAQRKWNGRTFAKWFHLLVLNMVQHLNITISVILVSPLMPFM